MQIVCSLSYWSDDVTTFDPEKVIAKLCDAFPEAEVSLTDQSAAEVERVQEFVASQTDADSSLLERQCRLLDGIQAKARRNGPVFSFRIADIYGSASRYRVSFYCATEIHPSVRKRIVTFLKSLKLGTVSVSTSNTGPTRRLGGKRRWWKFWA